MATASTRYQADHKAADQQKVSRSRFAMFTLLIFAANFVAWCGFVLATWSDNLSNSEVVWGCITAGSLFMIFGGLTCRLILLRLGLAFRHPRLFWVTSLLFSLGFWFLFVGAVELHMPCAPPADLPAHSGTEAHFPETQPVEGVLFLQRPWLVHRLWITLFRETFCHSDIRCDKVADFALSISLPLMGLVSAFHLLSQIRGGRRQWSR